MPFSTAGRKFCGIDPPKILSTNSKPVPWGSGSMSITHTPNWPRPPLCFLCLPSTPVILRLIVSKYGTLGGCRIASTPNLRFIRARATSTCTWPVPETSSSPVRGSRLTRNTGSSSISRARALEIFYSSPLDLGSSA